MLNKLLKRCMPWMDKGRWYHVKITGELVDNVPKTTSIKYDNSMFSHHEIDVDSGGLIKLYFSNPSIKACIIDIKTVVRVDEYPSIILPTNIEIDKGSDSSGIFLILYPWPGDYDVWLFIKTN